jgi:xanthine dehydrogenase accessory factor
MPDDLLSAQLAARDSGTPCVLATVVSVRGSAPREPGAKALIYEDSTIVGTVGGGKFESLVIADALATLQNGAPALKTYPLHEHSPESFGAICGGEVTVFLEPQVPREALLVIGAGHCARAICQLARECGMHVTVLDSREDQLALCPAHARHTTPAPEFIAAHPWRGRTAVIIVSRNYEFDREALAAVLRSPGPAYVGMIGSNRKVTRVFDELRARSISPEALASVYAPIGLDIGADSPAEIAVSVIAEVLKVLRGGTGASLVSPPK